ncbi:hypothetical protein [Phormidium sp. FACHB-592]|nr:hypothetical protein [Phormidium sp. FACHB-592]
MHVIVAIAHINAMPPGLELCQTIPIRIRADFAVLVPRQIFEALSIVLCF